MTARYDRTLNGVRDAQLLRTIFAAAGVILERDKHNVARVVPVSFFCAAKVGDQPNLAEENNPGVSLGEADLPITEEAA